MPFLDQDATPGLVVLYLGAPQGSDSVVAGKAGAAALQVDRTIARTQRRERGKRQRKRRQHTQSPSHDLGHRGFWIGEPTRARQPARVADAGERRPVIEPRERVGRELDSHARARDSAPGAGYFDTA